MCIRDSHNGTQGIFDQFHSYIVIADIENQDFLLELCQIFHRALGERLDLLGRLSGTSFPRGSDTHNIPGLRIGVQEGIGHGRKIIAAVSYTHLDVYKRQASIKAQKAQKAEEKNIDVEAIAAEAVEAAAAESAE